MNNKFLIEKIDGYWIIEESLSGVKFVKPDLKNALELIEGICKE